MPSLIAKFISALRTEGIDAVRRAINHPLFWDLIIVFVSVIWLLITVLVVFGFRGIQSSGFESMGENIVVHEDKKDVGISFLVSFVLPLLIDEVASLRDFIFFFTMLVLVLSLLIRSNLFYQNPILTLLGYKVCVFKVLDPALDLQPYANREFIGITYGRPITDQVPIERIANVDRWRGKFIVNEEDNTIDLQTYVHVERFIDLLDERYTKSEITDTEYDTDVKKEASPVEQETA